MAMTLSTTLSHITTVPNSSNSKIIIEFYHYMKSIGTSENYQNQNLKAIIVYAKFLGPDIAFNDIQKREQIVTFLDTKIKSNDIDPDVIVIGVGIAVLGVVGYYTYNLLIEDSPSGQLARSRLGLDKYPGAYILQDPKVRGYIPNPSGPGYRNLTKRAIENPDFPQDFRDALKRIEHLKAEEYFGKGTVGDRPFQQQRQQQEALTKTNNDNNTLKLYENATYGIHIQYPSNWKIIINEGFATNHIVSFLAPVRADSEADRPSLIISYIHANNLPFYRNLNEYLAEITERYDFKFIDFNLIESSTNSSLAGEPAYKLVFTDLKHDINFKSMEIGTIIGNKVYTVTYTAGEKELYSYYLPTVQKMIDSLKITTS
jgi:hypothetical protein